MRAAARSAATSADHACLARRVETDRGLVEHEHGRLHGQQRGERQKHAAALAQVVGVDVGGLGQPGRRQRRRHGPLATLGGEAQLARPELDLGAHAAREHLSVGVLEAHGHARRQVRHAAARDVRAVHAARARGSGAAGR